VSDPNDRRSVRATLTRAGQRRHDQATTLLAAREAEIVAALDAASAPSSASCSRASPEALRVGARSASGRAGAAEQFMCELSRRAVD
jgi:DNA-binding MarR family transcriptional regulator